MKKESDQQELDEDEIEPNTCVKCGDVYELRVMEEQTKYCDHCAQDRVEELESVIQYIVNYGKKSGISRVVQVCYMAQNGLDTRRVLRTCSK